MSFWSDAIGFLGGAARAVPGWSEAAFFPVGVTAEAIKAVTPDPTAPAPTAIAPPLSVDQTDLAVQQAAATQRRRLMIGGGQNGTFLSGTPVSNLSAAGT